MRRQAFAIAVAVVLGGCASAQAPLAAQAPAGPIRIVLSDRLENDAQVCVPSVTTLTGDPTFACVRLDSLRRQLRAQRYARR